MKKSLSIILVIVMLMAIMPMAFADVLVTFIELNPSSSTVASGGTTKVTATVSPDTATNKAVTYTTNNANVTVDSDGNVSVGSSATAGDVVTITATASDGSGITGTCTITVADGAVTAVTFDKTTADLGFGETMQITATVTPAYALDKSLSWSSDKPSVANVSDAGLVTTGTTEGTANIKAVSINGVSATCVVTVTDVKVTGVTLNKTEAALEVGATETLTATVEPSNATVKTVKWSSSDTSVATVEETTGVVTAVKAGSATITATTDDGGKTASCAVTVNNVAVTGVTVDPTTKQLLPGQTVTITPTVSPTNATNKTVTWTSSNTSVATVDATTGVVTAKAAGSAVITCTTADGNKTATCTITVPTTYAVTYKPGTYGTGTIATATKTQGTALTLSGAIFTRSGYTQTGWTTTDGGTQVYALGASYATDANIDLYPVWTVNSHTITFSKYQGSNLGRAYYRFSTSDSWTEVTSAYSFSNIQDGTVVYFRMVPYSGYYSHPYVYKLQSGGYYAVTPYNYEFSVTVTENLQVRLNFTSVVPTGDTGIWQYVVAALASASAGTGIVIGTKRKHSK